jgi:hypothetical protein
MPISNVYSFTLVTQAEAREVKKTYNWMYKKEKDLLHLKFNWQLVSYPLYPVT